MSVHNATTGGSTEEDAAAFVARPGDTGAREARFSLYRSHRQSLAWALRSLWFRWASVALVAVLLAAGSWWQWPLIADTYERIASSFQPEQKPWDEIAEPAFSDTYDEQRTAALNALTRAIGAAEGVIASKRADGVEAAQIEPVEALVTRAQRLIEADILFVTPITDITEQLAAATSTLQSAQPPAAPPPPSGGSNSGGGGGTTGGGGAPSGGGGGSKTITVSASVSCPPGNVTAHASGGGTVTVTISGPASASGSGGGSATATAAGPAGTYTATATGTGSVTITSLSCS